MTPWARVVRVLLLIPAVLLAGVLTGWVLMNYALQEGEVSVPDIEGKELVFAIDVLNARGLRLKIGEQEFSTTVPKNSIISQEPQSGQWVKRGREIRVVVSKGLQEIAVPDVTGQPFRRAETIIRENGLRVGAVSRVHHSTVEQGLVMAQNPESQATISRGETVNLLISAGPRRVALMMPDLVGRSLNGAMGLIEGMGLQLGRVDTRPGDGVAPGLIIDQDPKPGFPVEEGQKVNLVTARELGGRR